MFLQHSNSAVIGQIKRMIGLTNLLVGVYATFSVSFKKKPKVHFHFSVPNISILTLI